MYSANGSKRLRIRPPRVPVLTSGRLKMVSVFQLDGVKDKLTNEADVMLSRDTKCPDAVLGNSELDEPIIALEVGFSEPLEELFNDARRLLQGSKGRIQIVILIKIFENGRGKPMGPPWGLSEQELREKLADNSLKHIVDIVVDWHRNNNTPLIGE